MLKQRLQQKLQQKLSPQQIQLMKMIQLPTLGFEQKLKQEVEENLALEIGHKENDDEEQDIYQEEAEAEDSGNEVIETDFNVDDYLSDDETPSYKLQTSNYSVDDEEKKVPYASGITFNQFLLEQLNTILLSDKEYTIAKFIIGSLDDSGYLRRTLDDLVDDLAFSLNIYTNKEDVRKLLELIQQLDPPGVAARNLQECLSIQLTREKTTTERKLALQIINTAFDHFTKKHYQQLITKFNISKEELKKAISVIKKLNPKPGGNYIGNTKIIEQVIPDFTIKIIDDNLSLSLNSRNAPELYISKEYTELLKTYKDSQNKTKMQQDAVLFVKQKLDGAKWFIDAVRQRQQTLILTMDAIMNYQKNYFLTGDEKELKPMILKDIADIVKMDISTVSRVANSKYVDTPYGTKLIKSFFSESIKNTAGEEISTKEIKTILHSIINKENTKKPYTDEQLSKLLKKEGYKIARRTVAKYREQLNISVARLRKQI